MSPLATYVVETLVTLVAIVALSVLVLYGARRLGVGKPSGPMQLVGRLPIDARRSVYLVQIGKVIYVLGSGDNGLNKLGEFPASDIDLENPGESSGFAAILERARSKPIQAAPAVEADSHPQDENAA